MFWSICPHLYNPHKSTPFIMIWQMIINILEKRPQVQFFNNEHDQNVSFFHHEQFLSLQFLEDTCQNWLCNIFFYHSLILKSGNKSSYLSATNLKHLLHNTCCFSSFLLSNRNLFFMIVRHSVMIVQHLSHLKFNVLMCVLMNTTSSSGVFMISSPIYKQKNN